jgi:hypothetical protein
VSIDCLTDEIVTIIVYSVILLMKYSYLNLITEQQPGPSSLGGRFFIERWMMTKYLRVMQKKALMTAVISPPLPN